MAIRLVIKRFPIRLLHEELPKVLPEFEVDYTPMFVLPYSKLPEDLLLWEKRKSWLLDDQTRSEIKKLGGTLVAKSLNKDATKAATIWRLSLNAAPVFEKLFSHLKQDRCNAKTVLKLIKDIKKVALKEEDKEFLKSYNVRQALLFCAHEMGGSSITEAELLLEILKKVSSFLKSAFFPSYLEEKRNLVFKSSRERCREGHERLEEIIAEVDKWVAKVNEEQAAKKETLLRMSQRLRREMSELLVIRPMVVNWITSGFAGKAKIALGIQNPPNTLSEQITDERVTVQIKQLVEAIFRYLLDRERIEEIFHEMELD